MSYQRYQCYKMADIAEELKDFMLLKGYHFENMGWDRKRVVALSNELKELHILLSSFDGEHQHER